MTVFISSWYSFHIYGLKLSNDCYRSGKKQDIPELKAPAIYKPL